MLVLDGLQLVGVQPEQAQDGRCDLGGLDGLAEGMRLVVDAGPGDDERYVAVPSVRASVFGDRPWAAGVDAPVPDNAEQLGYAGAPGGAKWAARSVTRRVRASFSMISTVVRRLSHQKCRVGGTACDAWGR